MNGLRTFRKRSVAVRAWRFREKEPVPEPLRDALIIDPVTKAVTISDKYHGNIPLKEGDWIIIDINGETYPCVDEVFQKTYDPLSLAKVVLWDNGAVMAFNGAGEQEEEFQGRYEDVRERVIGVCDKSTHFFFGRWEDFEIPITMEQFRTGKFITRQDPTEVEKDDEDGKE